MSQQSIDSTLYKLISDQALMAILVMNQDGGCIYANTLSHSLLEFPLDFDLTKFNLQSLYPKSASSNRMRALSADVFESEGLIQEIMIQKLNGQAFIGTLGVKKIVLNKKQHILLMIQDITLQKKLQREVTEKQAAITQAYQDLLMQNKQLKELDAAKNRFIAVTTHELRTPLSAMVASAEILKMKLYDTTEQHDEFLNMIYDQGQHLLNLVNDILDFAKIQAGKMDYFVQKKSLFSVVEKEVEALQSMAQGSNVTMTLLPFSENSDCYFDEVRIKQVLANLINNAIKYNKEKGSVKVYLKSEPNTVQVYVEDSGKGIPEEALNKVFNEFETLGKVANHAKGTGLGLPISQRMMRSMGGDVKLTSEAGVGSVFWIEVPTQQVLPAENYRSRPEDTGSGDLAA